MYVRYNILREYVPWYIIRGLNMINQHNPLISVLKEYRKFLTIRRLAKKQNIPFLVKWVHQFLLFAHVKTGVKFETVLEMFRNHLENDLHLKDWQLRQAIDSIMIYKFD